MTWLKKIHSLKIHTISFRISALFQIIVTSANAFPLSYTVDFWISNPFTIAQK